MTSRDEGHDQGNKAEDPPVSANLFPPILGLIGIGVLACAVWALGINDNYSGEALLHCSVIADDPAQWRVPTEEPIEALLGSERLRTLGALMAVDRNGVLAGVVTFEQVRRAVAAAFPAR